MSKERLNIPVNREEFFEEHEFGFDHDGVMADTRTPIVDEYNKIFGTEHTVNEIREYRTLARWAEEDLGISKKAALEIDNYLWFKRPDILLRAKPMPGAVEITKQLADRKKISRIITSRLPSYRQSTFEWYEEELPWIKRDKIIIRETNEMDGEIFKVWGINFFGISAFFEDMHHHGREIIIYTDAKLILLSNSSALDSLAGNQMIRIASKINQLPTLQEAQNYLFHT
jgi:5'(3')-deoxyribonucleotidase